MSNNIKNEKTVSSIIRRFIPEDCQKQITYIANLQSDTFHKRKAINGILKSYNLPFTILGSGTNRLGVKFGQYAFKFAYDNEGKIDNIHEYLYNKELQPFVIDVYEISDDCNILVTEYVDVITTYEFSKKRRTIAAEECEVIETLAPKFIIGDVGVSSKNCNNWGTRFRNGGLQYVILDYAYIYRIEDVMACPYCHGGNGGKRGRLNTLFPSQYGTELVCRYCGREIKFEEVAHILSYNDSRLLEDYINKGMQVEPDKKEMLISSKGPTDVNEEQD